MKCKVQVNQLRGKVSYGVFLETLRGMVFLRKSLSTAAWQQCRNIN